MTNNITSTDALKRIAFGNPIWRVTIGDAYSTGEYWTDVTVGNTKEVYLENPSEDTYIGIYEFEVRVSAEAKVDKAINVTEDTPGDPPPTGIQNKLSNASGTVATAALGGDGETGVYSGGDSYNAKGVGSGTAGNANPGSSGKGGFANVLAPGDNILLSVTNASSSSMNYISVDVDWAEIPAETYPA